MRVLEAAKPLALLAYLAASDGRAASRDRLVTLLWSHMGREDARRNLRVAINKLQEISRLHLGHDGLLATRERVSLSCPIAFDRDDVLAASARGDVSSQRDPRQSSVAAGTAKETCVCRA
jgi:DNA-binding SARP family transcriptional activator